MAPPSLDGLTMLGADGLGRFEGLEDGVDLRRQPRVPARWKPDRRLLLFSRARERGAWSLEP
eukprot:2778007-Prymnesium_polylepis.1